MMIHNFKEFALQKFSGCDNSELEAGTPQEPSIWLLGLEHGTFNSKHDGSEKKPGEDEYSIECQLRWPYNRSALKLLSVIDGQYEIKDYKKFAFEKQPFVLGQKGYFKGNLYPYPCHNIGAWNSEAKSVTGFETKAEYQVWCMENRTPKMKEWIDEHCPSLVIGVGLGSALQFSKAVFGKEVNFAEKTFNAGNKQMQKRILMHSEEGKKLIVFPHFSGVNGLNSHDAIRQAGLWAKRLIEEPK